MKVVIDLAIAIIFGTWLAIAAVVSIQNIEAISLRFFIWRSIEIPFGVLLAFAVGVGAILGAMLALLFPRRRLPVEEDPLEIWDEED